MAIICSIEEWKKAIWCSFNGPLSERWSLEWAKRNGTICASIAHATNTNFNNKNISSSSNRILTAQRKEKGVKYYIHADIKKQQHQYRKSLSAITWQWHSSRLVKRLEINQSHFKHFDESVSFHLIFWFNTIEVLFRLKTSAHAFFVSSLIFDCLLAITVNTVYNTYTCALYRITRADMWEHWCARVHVHCRGNQIVFFVLLIDLNG